MENIDSVVPITVWNIVCGCFFGLKETHYKFLFHCVLPKTLLLLRSGDVFWICDYFLDFNTHIFYKCSRICCKTCTPNNQGSLLLPKPNRQTFQGGGRFSQISKRIPCVQLLLCTREYKELEPFTIDKLRL
jgi:hypothetical protein